MTDEELKAIKQRWEALNLNSWCDVDAWITEHGNRDVRALIAEVERLRAEINRIAPFLALHGVEGYTIQPAMLAMSTLPGGQ